MCIFELALSLLIIKYVSYTEIDWIAYGEEVDGFFKFKEYDYRKLGGHTGPLVYPAGFVYCYGFIRWITGEEVRNAQVLFAFLYVFNQWLALRILQRSGKVPIAFYAATCLSKRMHSIFTLRMFNDGVCTIFCHLAVLAFMDGAKKEKEKKAKKASEGKAATASTKRVDVSTLDVRVGRVTKAWEHPDAEKLWCENIDLGEKGVRQICSGLRAFKTKEQMEGARVCVIVNVKPGKLRDVKSDGLVLCASNADHTEVDFVIPPEGAAIGERVAFPGFEGEPEEVLNPKKKQLDAVCLDLKTNAEGVACYKDVPFTTSAGACTSSLKNCFIK